jgi:hypothetical protein
VRSSTSGTGVRKSNLDIRAVRSTLRIVGSKSVDYGDKAQCTAASGRPDVSTASLRITLVCATRYTRSLGYQGDLPLYPGLQRYEAAHPRSRGFQHVPPAPDAKQPARVVVHYRLSWR